MVCKEEEDRVKPVYQVRLLYNCLSFIHSLLRENNDFTILAAAASAKMAKTASTTYKTIRS